jgi:hypothetical protein
MTASEILLVLLHIEWPAGLADEMDYGIITECF